MASVSLKHIFKKYPGGVTAVTDFCLEIKVVYHIGRGKSIPTWGNYTLSCENTLA